ncbi:hypothetical protein BDP55DRAFT_663985 [Colletotrichum godetiae]|uniref:Uncharacterized protein n=1 Tax=Colletotrichum godetiae TaxID=1209918 RepID=A0AAJ0APD1_9PEZI|nr:uncharacterized protein BDP55DRAFT_663985 [Colletotrichum godetiae]KAK1675361.1 hypothetical protein BDP55DRAFT_663985 [Colletotrichum godetiae]
MCRQDAAVARVQPFNLTTLYSTPNHQSQKSGRHLNAFLQRHFHLRKLTEIKGLAENASDLGYSRSIGFCLASCWVRNQRWTMTSEVRQKVGQADSSRQICTQDPMRFAEAVISVEKRGSAQAA